MYLDVVESNSFGLYAKAEVITFLGSPKTCKYLNENAEKSAVTSVRCPEKASVLVSAKGRVTGQAWRDTNTRA